jgi:hypothetical protein
MIVLRNVTVVKIGDAQVEDDVKKKRKIQDDKIKTIIPNPYDPLYVQIDPKNPDRFNEKV